MWNKGPYNKLGPNLGYSQPAPALTPRLAAPYNDPVQGREDLGRPGAMMAYGRGMPQFNQRGMGIAQGMPQIQPGMQMDPNRMPGNAMAQGVPSMMQGTQQMPQWTQAGVPQPGMPPRSGGAPIAPMNQMAPRPPGAPMGMMSPPPMNRMDPKAFKKLMANATQTDAMGTHNQAATRAQFLANQGRLSDKQMKKLGITARR